MADNETSLRDDLAAAMDAAEDTAPDTTPDVVTGAPITGDQTAPTETPTIGDTQEQSDQRARDEKGRFAAKTGEAPPKEAAKEPVKVALKSGAPPSTEPPPITEPVVPQVKAPASWKPTAREGWAKVPADIQQEVIRRERETAMALQESSEARQGFSKFREITTPYETLFRSEGVDAMTGIANMMQTTAMLATGPAPMRAQIVASLIKTYGVDIATLDAILSGQQAPQQAPQQYQPQPMRDPRLDSLLEQAQQRTQQKAAAQLEAVSAQEFFEDVREDMADILEVASKRGFQMSAQDAYNRAILLHPEVSKVVEQRKAAANPGGSTQRARDAASSIRGSPTAGPPAPSGGSLKDDLEAAWDRASARK